MEKKYTRLILSVAHDASRINLKRGSAKRCANEFNRPKGEIF